MKSKTIGVALFAAACLSFSTHSALAGFTSLYVEQSPGSTIPVPYYDADPDAGTLDVYETWDSEHGTSYSFDVAGTTDEDPPLHIIKEVTNGTGLAWIGYKLDLDPSDPHTFELISPPPSSDVFSLVSSSPTSIVFGLPSPVGPGDTVTLDTVINIVTSGGFSFTLTQSPITVPEPGAAAFGLLSLSIVAVCRRRRSA